MTGIFTPQQLDRILAETLPKVPDGHTSVIVAAVDERGAKVVAGFTLGEDANWTLQGAFEHDWTGDNRVGGKVLVSW